MEKIRKGKLFGIGIGPGDSELLTMKAVKAIKQSEVVFVPKSEEQKSTALRIAKPYLSDSAVIVELEFSMSKNVDSRVQKRKECASVVEQFLSEGKNCAFLTLGDPMLYSTFTYLLQLISDENVEIIPGIYSFGAISASLNLPLVSGDESMVVLSDFLEEKFAVYAEFETIVCMKITAYAPAVARFLNTYKNYSFVCVSNAGKAGEQVLGTADVLLNKLPYFSTAILKKIE